MYDRLTDYRSVLAVDVGANVGFWCNDLAEHFDHVMAYEPMPYNTECLRHNCTQDNITIRETALGDHTGETVIYTPSAFESGSATMDASQLLDADQHTVEITTLDSEAESWTEQQRAHCLIKIDVQGHEREVLAGARDLIRNYGPAICCEVRANREHRPGWIRHFNEMGYTLLANYKKEHLFVPKGRSVVQITKR